MKGHGYTLAGSRQPHVRTAPPSNGEAAPLESLDNCGPGKITRELQAVTRIGSLMKWRRILPGVSPCGLAKGATPTLKGTSSK